MTDNPEQDADDFADLLGPLGNLDANDVESNAPEPAASLREQVIGAVVADAATTGGAGEEDLLAWPAADESLTVQRPVSDMQAHRQKRVLQFLGGTAAAAAALVVALVLILGTGEPETSDFAILDPSFATAATFEFVEVDDGWEVELSVDGVPVGEQWDLWVKEPGQERVKVGTIVGDPDDTVRFVTPIAPDEAERIWVTDAAGELVLDATL